MILLITASSRGQECASALGVATAQPAQVAHTLHDAAATLRSTEFSAVVIDQCLVDADPEQEDLVLQRVGTATLIYVNCAISGMERVIRDVRAALRRREMESVVARRAAEQALRSELREPLTAMLLNCDLALSLPDLPAPAHEKIKAVHEQACRMASRLEVEELAGEKV